MNKLTTHKGDTILLIEVPLDAYDIGKDMQNMLSYKLGDGRYFEKINQHFEIIGTTSNEQIKELIKDFTFTKGVSGDNWYKCDDLNEFLEVNNIDINKNYCVLKLKND